MSEKEKPLPVIIRYEGPGRASSPDVRFSDIVAVFPTLLGESNDPRTMECYSTMGQHSTCHAGYIGSKTKPATPEQVQKMLHHLRGLGYENLKAVSRASSHHAAERRREWRR